MRKKYDITLIKMWSTSLLEDAVALSKIIKTRIPALLGEVTSSEQTWVDGHKESDSKEIVNPEQLRSVKFVYSENELRCGFNHDKSIFSLNIFIDESSNIEIDEISQTLRVLNREINPTVLFIRDRDSKVVEQTFKVNNVSPTDYAFVADIPWVSIYPSKKFRDKYYLPVEDSFYLNIPAYNVEKLENGAILVELHKNPEASLEELVQQESLVVKYYRQELTKMGLWREVKWWPDWRDKYRDFLKEKGIVV